MSNSSREAYDEFYAHLETDDINDLPPDEREELNQWLDNQDKENDEPR